MALWSCINQLNAGRPEEEVSLPLVHLAYHRFRNRLQNFSRILTIHPPILLSLTKGTQNHNWAGREMVWPVLGIFRACSPAWPPQASVEGGVLPPPPWEGEAYGPCSNRATMMIFYFSIFSCVFLAALGLRCCTWAFSSCSPSYNVWASHYSGFSRVCRL